ncbi:hypothetical protein PISMIDRAFT_212590 [Pisolithus microcarpus 441]|uniref:Unplaced genomic scaffold scaffold_137, whole genome shotgun sequence n=1 Tax=Pisolithus microcarpus 441 TaxID=765257 RepID=A0A0C9ZCM2_9AGAM|nr:hypothetical protein PISMIDRAFT_212590 [Pisolithus microcarpus 441]
MTTRSSGATSGIDVRGSIKVRGIFVAEQGLAAASWLSTNSGRPMVYYKGNESSSECVAGSDEGPGKRRPQLFPRPPSSIMSNPSSVLRFYYDPVTEVERAMEEALVASAISDRPSVVRPRYAHVCIVTLVE